MGRRSFALLGQAHHDQGLGLHAGQERNNNIMKEPALEITQRDEEVADTVGEDIGVGVAAKRLLD